MLEDNLKELILSFLHVGLRHQVEFWGLVTNTQTTFSMSLILYNFAYLCVLLLLLNINF